MPSAVHSKRCPEMICLLALLSIMCLTACGRNKQPPEAAKPIPCQPPHSLMLSCEKDAAGNPTRPLPPETPATDVTTARFIINQSEWAETCAARHDALVNFVEGECSPVD
ncbi:MAG: hypothetical protein Alpg2KO_00670 [Alphaproteobacteria bacterium]